MSLTVSVQYHMTIFPSWRHVASVWVYGTCTRPEEITAVTVILSQTHKAARWAMAILQKWFERYRCHVLCMSYCSWIASNSTNWIIIMQPFNWILWNLKQFYIVITLLYTLRFVTMSSVMYDLLPLLNQFKIHKLASLRQVMIKTSWKWIIHVFISSRQVFNGPLKHDLMPLIWFKIYELSFN